MSKKLKRYVKLLATFTLLIHINPRVASADEAEALTELLAEVSYFYLHPSATDFMSTFYTQESYEHLRNTFSHVQQSQTTGWETALSDAEITELYQLLHAATTNLHPLIIRRGEATSQGENLNFRAQPATETQVFHTLTYGTSFEILAEVQGGTVTGTDGISSDRWFRIRHNGQPGYVHGRYVRDLPVSEGRVTLIANIGRQTLWIESLIDGWRTDFAPTTQQQLHQVLTDTQALQVGNWQFEASYAELEHMLASLSYEHVNFVTLVRYNLINTITQLVAEIEANMAGSGTASQIDFTEESWERMTTALTDAQALLIENWQEELSDEELEVVRGTLQAGLNRLERLPEEAPATTLWQDTNLELALIIGVLIAIGIALVIVLFKIVRTIQNRKFHE
ncbi:MAG: SH3 domain-containing protein [Turicibacter sp.]|nr:SH3 domain-containing protein [Turicibacter sp.]